MNYFREAPSFACLCNLTRLRNSLGLWWKRGDLWPVNLGITIAGSEGHLSLVPPPISCDRKVIWLWYSFSYHVFRRSSDLGTTSYITWFEFHLTLVPPPISCDPKVIWPWYRLLYHVIRHICYKATAYANMTMSDPLTKSMPTLPVESMSTLPAESMSNESTWNKSMPTIPADMMFSDEHLLSVVVYSILFVIAAGGNLTVFVTLFRCRKRRTRISLFIMHLCIADLLITFIIIPLEVGLC